MNKENYTANWSEEFGKINEDFRMHNNDCRCNEINNH